MHHNRKLDLTLGVKDAFNLEIFPRHCGLAPHHHYPPNRFANPASSLGNLRPVHLGEGSLVHEVTGLQNGLALTQLAAACARVDYGAQSVCGAFHPPAPGCSLNELLMS